MSLYKPFTTTTGVLVPVLSIDMLPSDWMRINTHATVQSLPMIAPVRGRWKCSFDYFYNPWSNIYGFMDGNRKLTTQQIIENYRYVVSLGKDNTGVTFSSILREPKVPCGGVLDFLGFPIGYQGVITKNTGGSGYNQKKTSHPAEGIITYLDIVRNYYVNNQENSTKFIRATNSVGLDGRRLGYWYSDFSLDTLDSAITEFRYRSRNGLSSEYSISGIPSILPYYNGLIGVEEDGNLSDNQMDVRYLCGLFLRTYRMDLLRGIMNSSVGTYNAKLDATSGYVTMDNVYFANKAQTLINRIDITGGRFSDWIRTRWNTDPGIDVDRPIYLGSHSLWLNTIDVIATASGQNTGDNKLYQSSLGQQVGYQIGKMSSDKQRPITIKSKQYGTLMCIFSIVPDVVYSQGFELNMLKTRFADIYDPAFKQVGFQDVLRAEVRALPCWYLEGSTNPMSYFDDNALDKKIGKRIAWSEYMASLNRSHSDFAYGMGLDFWVNNRAYNLDEDESPIVDGGNSDIDQWQNSNIKRLFSRVDYTTYVYPHLWNGAFANKSISARNYVVDVHFSIDANRALGKRLMPHL